MSLDGRSTLGRRRCCIYICISLNTYSFSWSLAHWQHPLETLYKCLNLMQYNTIQSTFDDHCFRVRILKPALSSQLLRYWFLVKVLQIQRQICIASNGQLCSCCTTGKMDECVDTGSNLPILCYKCGWIFSCAVQFKFSFMSVRLQYDVYTKNTGRILEFEKVCIQCTGWLIHP